jgi:hypothetical protein
VCSKQNQEAAKPTMYFAVPNQGFQRYPLSRIDETSGSEMGFLELLGLKQAKPKPAALVEAEKCFAPEELQAIRDAFKRALKAQGMHGVTASQSVRQMGVACDHLDSIHLPCQHTGHGKSLHDEAFNVLLFGVPSGDYSQMAVLCSMVSAK